MPATAARPDRTHALIVGIERYAVGAQWDLDGPLNDALAILEWLLSCHVPAEQIHLHVAPLDKNQERLLNLQCNIQNADENAIRETIQRIKNKSPQPDDLLFLYWAGHGLISQAQQCLLLAEATDADMKSYGVDNGDGSLCASFANEHCPSFSQQIFLFDTCRTFHRHPDSPLPVVPLPSGKRLQKSQFLFFACQEGQAAKNQVQKGCGRFTEVLLEQLHANHAPADCWPPDMDSIATAVQQDFRENEQQYPVWKRYRDSKGNELIDPFPAADLVAASQSFQPLGLTRSSGQPCDIESLNDQLHQAILNGLGTGDPTAAWEKVKACVFRCSYEVEGDHIQGKAVIVGLKPASLEGEVQQVIDLCRDIDNGFMLLDTCFKTFRSSMAKIEAKSCLGSYASWLPNQQCYMRTLQR